MSLEVETQLAALENMSVGELHERYEDVFGEPSRSRHRRYLIRRIAWRLQANAEGGLTERALQRAAELANDADVRVMPPRHGAKPLVAPPAAGAAVVRVPVTTDSRLPAPGAAITRKYKGRTINVVVLPDGFEYDGQRYKSLSAVTTAITGSHMNGFRFFRLGVTS
ncbi:MAG: DUF2924 domain-containing protein [Phycisphaerae bacterium]|nr:DUF2924 domain-containing protein [Phycisphaerae bacterium]